MCVVLGKHFPVRSRVLKNLREKVFYYIVEEMENYGNKHFFYFSTMFSAHPFWRMHRITNIYLSSANTFSWDKTKNRFCFVNSLSAFSRYLCDGLIFVWYLSYKLKMLNSFILRLHLLLRFFLIEKRKLAYYCLPSKDSINYSLSLLGKGWFLLWSFYSVQNASCSFTCI